MTRSFYWFLTLSMGSLWLSAADWPRWGGSEANGKVPDNAVVPLSLREELKTVWYIPIGPGLGSPVMSGGKVFYLDNQQDHETVHAVEAATGKSLWSTPFDEVFKDSQSAAGPRSTPVVDGEK